MKVLIISNMYPSEYKPYSGIFVKNQYNELNKNPNLNVKLYALPRTFTNRLGSILKYINFFLCFTPFFFKKYQVIHVHFFSYHVILGYIYKILHPRTKLIITFHGSDTKNIEKPIYNFILKKSTIQIAVGIEQGKYIKEKTRSNNIVILSAGIDEQYFYLEQNIKKEYDFIFVGSFYEIKGIDIFIEAIKILNDNSLTVCFVGSGKFEHEIKQLNLFCKVEIKYNLNQNEIRKVINKSKFLVLPSRGDSFGLVVSEAMYCGVPVIVSNTGGVMQQVKSNYNGYITTENTSNCLAKYLFKAKEIDSNTYSIMSANALNSNKEYSLQEITKELINIYSA